MYPSENVSVDMKPPRLKFFLILVLMTISLFAPANMASPVDEGTMGAVPFINQYADITKEIIHIVPDEKFQTARFQIEYQIRASRPGIRIPLLFYASEYREDFKIRLDDTPVTLQEVPQQYEKLAGTPFEDFGYFFHEKVGNEIPGVNIAESPTTGFVVTIGDLKFFDVDFSEGPHTLNVEYTADQWIDRSDWIRKRNFRYALSPAKYWKSFGSLEITVDASQFKKKISTNLGKPTLGTLDSIATWSFTTLPVEVVQINYNPEVSWMASRLIYLEPEGLSLFFAILLVGLHLLLMRRFRKKYASKRFSWVMITGSLLVPLLVLIGFILSYYLIDASIGEEAGRYHGYEILVIIFYPVILPVYWPIMWWIDKTWSKKLLEPSRG